MVIPYSDSQMNSFRNGTLTTPRICQSGALEDESTPMDILLYRLEADIRAGQQVGAIPTELARAMRANVGRAEDPDSKIEGEVFL